LKQKIIKKKASENRSRELEAENKAREFEAENNKLKLEAEKFKVEAEAKIALEKFKLEASDREKQPNERERISSQEFELKKMELSIRIDARGDSSLGSTNRVEHPNDHFRGSGSHVQMSKFIDGKDDMD